MFDKTVGCPLTIQYVPDLPNLTLKESDNLERLLKREDVQEILRIGRTKLYRLLQDGDLPPPIRIGPRAMRWRAEEVEEWLANQPRTNRTNT